MNINATFTNISYCPLVCDTINKQADDYQRFHPNAFSADKKKRIFIGPHFKYSFHKERARLNAKQIEFETNKIDAHLSFCMLIVMHIYCNHETSTTHLISLSDKTIRCFDLYKCSSFSHTFFIPKMKTHTTLLPVKII